MPSVAKGHHVNLFMSTFVKCCITQTLWLQNIPEYVLQLDYERSVEVMISWVGSFIESG